MLYPQTTLNCNGTLLDLKNPIVMGILNLTPDSFYDGGKFNNERTILLQVEKMLSEGASIIDIGGMSSRPGAEMISEQEELSRVIPIIQLIKKKFPNTIISIDTFRSKIVTEAIPAGASIINDISAGSIDDKLFETVAQYKVPYILMHMQGTPQTMQNDPQYDDLIPNIMDFFVAKIEQLRKLGVMDIVLDLGFGFGKTLDQNYELLKKMHVFKLFDLIVLAGISRKSMVYNYLNTSAKDALNGTTTLHVIALQQGAKILRAHDVKEAMETIKLWQKIEDKPTSDQSNI